MHKVLFFDTKTGNILKEVSITILKRLYNEIFVYITIKSLKSKNNMLNLNWKIDRIKPINFIAYTIYIHIIIVILIIYI